MNNIPKPAVSTAVTYEEWEQAAINMTVAPGKILDCSSMKKIKDHPKIVGFMTGPVGVYNSKPIEAMARRLNDISKLDELLSARTGDILMYQILQVPDVMEDATLDQSTKEIIKIYAPRRMDGFWLIRYVEVLR